MFRLAISVLAACLFLIPFDAHAALRVGEKAPDFTVQASVGGKEFTFSLADSLKNGPVVVYFYPKSFTKGCTIEAHEFADAADRFAALRASLIGVSADGIDIQKQFSTMECRDKFPVAADPDMTVIRAYDAVMTSLPGKTDIADRISYVIAPDRTVLYTFTALAPDQHVENTLEIVQQWRKAHP